MTSECTRDGEDFKLRVRELIRKRSLGGRVVKIEKHDHVYTCSERSGTMYLIEKGQVKLLLSSPEAKECLFAIRTAGDFFGEVCFAGNSTHTERAVAMQETVLRQIPYRDFLATLHHERLMEGLVKHLAMRIAEQQELIAMLATLNSEQRLARMLMVLGRTLGKRATRGVCIEHKVSQLELAGMVGTTRTRIGIFLKRFRQLGLVTLNESRRLVIDEQRLAEYLERGASTEKVHRRRVPTLRTATQPAARMRIVKSDTQSALPPRGTMHGFVRGAEYP